jgi:GNAT superfamily N-acetyltransferase
MITIRRAKTNEYARLTQLSWASKQIWAYEEALFDVFKKEITLTPAYIAANDVFVAEENGDIAGYFSITAVTDGFYAGKVWVEKGFWLEHLFIHPQYIGKGIGRSLVSYAKELCRQKGIQRLRLFGDPHADGFYEKTGAVYFGKSPSSIEGRTVSVFEYAIIEEVQK